MQLPMITGMPAVGAPAEVPNFAYTMEELVGGRLLQITSLPNDFFETPEAPPVAPWHPALTGGMSADEGGVSGGPASGSSGARAEQ